MSSSADPTLEPSSARLGPWAVMFGTLCAAGGHGLFLAAAVWLELGRARAEGSGEEQAAGDLVGVLVGVGQGRLGAAAIAWILVAPLLALAALAARRALMRRAWLARLALLVVVLTACAFAIYLRSATGEGGAQA